MKTTFMNQLDIFTAAPPDPNKTEREKLQAIARAAGCRSVPGYPACWPVFIKDPVKQARAYELRNEYGYQARKRKFAEGTLPFWQLKYIENKEQFL